MSDVGKYDTLRDELVTAAAAVTGVVTATKTAGLEQLLDFDGSKSPTVGVAFQSMRPKGFPGVASRRFKAALTFDIWVVFSEKRGSKVALAEIDTTTERIRDALHFLKSASSAMGRYEVASEEAMATPARSGLYVRHLQYSIDVMLGV